MTTHPAPFPGTCTECATTYAAGDPIVWQDGGADRHAGCEPADSYRAAVRANYELSKRIATEPDMDTRFALRAEHHANHQVCVTSPLSAAEKAVISAEEFKRAYGRLSTTPKAKAQRRSQPWRMQG